MSFKFYIFSLTLFIISRICLATPLRIKDTLLGGIKENQRNEENRVESSIGALLIGLASSVCLILVAGICVCCGKNKFFKWSRRHPRRVVTSNARNGLGYGHEISIFPPPGADHYLSSTSDIYFEPLPDITSQLDNRNGLSRLSSSVASNLNEDWFAEPYKNFPRNQLQYLRKLGSGWFGQVLEGRAIGVDTDHTSTAITESSNSKLTPVVVKSLREDASQHEQAFFLQELRPYRDLDHKNILKVLAYCLETQPLLVLLQYCPKGDLKGFLKRNPSLADSNLLKMAENVSSGLAHMHMHDFIHTDLATRNCLVEEDMNVKIGDYGYSLQTYQEEYYLADNVALPLRWCSPETLKCTDTTIETIELTKPSNVWSFGVVLWEILSRGKLPYEDLDEDGIIQKVVLEGSRVLRAPPHSNTFYASKLDEILLWCFGDSLSRPDINSLSFLLGQLSSCLVETSSAGEDFESRWNGLSDNQQSQERSLSVVNDSFDLRFESDFNPGSGLRGKSSPTPSLKNFHGSAEDLDARIAAKFGSAVPSWLGLEPGQQMDSFTEEITDAIQKLDEALSEDRSESATSASSPEKGCANFRLGRDSLVLNPPLATRTLSDGEEENLTMRLEQGDFSELVRLKSQSVQDFMRLTVVDDGSDSSDKASQPGSIVGEFSALHHPQEKTFSSESNLKEAVRDAGFMVELERLQAEHKYSIISEVSREGMPSLEDFKLERESCYDEPCENENNGSFLDRNVPSSGMKGTSSPKKISLDVIKKTESLGYCKGEASPDCVVSSRDAVPSDPLPDILSHDGKVKLLTSSNSSLEEKNTLSQSNKDVKIPSFRNNFEGALSQRPNEDIFLVENESVFNGKFLNEKSLNDYENDLIEQNLPLNDKYSSFKGLNFDQNVSLTNESSNYCPENVIQGEDIVIGASDDFSLELYKPVKSNINTPRVNEFPLIEDNQSKDVNHNTSVNKNESFCNSSTLITEANKDESSLSNCEFMLSNSKVVEEVNDSLKVNGLIFVNGNSLDLKSAEKIGTSTNPFDSVSEHENLVNKSFDLNPEELLPSDVDMELSHKDKFLNDFAFDSNYEPFPKNSEVADGRSIDSLLDSEFKFLDDNLGSSDGSSKLDADDATNEFYSLNGNRSSNEHLVDKTLNVSSPKEARNLETKNPDVPLKKSGGRGSGAFWEQQMAAWQEAAEQTRELLFEASNHDVFGISQDSEDDLLDAFTKSPESSQKSPFSSTDCLDESDEGTYVSYDTTDDGDLVRFNADDLDALRSELNLKLGDLNEAPKNDADEETDNDVVFINYRNGCTLSPIKEEELTTDLDQSFASDSSVEFTEGKVAESSSGVNSGGGLHDDVFLDLSPLNLGGGLSSFELTAEEAKDSLILEDLDCEGTPTQPVVVGALNLSGSSEDLLVVDTETNKVTLIDSGRPQSHIAFLVEENKNDDLKFLTGGEVNNYHDDDDVAYESLPYEDNSGPFSSLLKSKEACVDDPTPDTAEEVSEDSKVPHYQSYFTSALSSISHPTLSLEGNDAFESADHVSLPYDVNFPVQTPPAEVADDESGTPKSGDASETKSDDAENVWNQEEENRPRGFSSESKLEAAILDEPNNKEENSSFVTLSFLGRLYNEAEKIDDNVSSPDRAREPSELERSEELLNASLGSSSEHFYSTKSEEDDSSENEIEEDILSDVTLQREGPKTPTPQRTPSDLEDYVWRISETTSPQYPVTCERYTPDWETDDSDGNDDVESSSTSGEFVWQPAETSLGASPLMMCLPSSDKTSLEWERATEGGMMMKTVEEEEEEEEERRGEEEEEEDEDSESGEEEFTPSTWNRELTPHRSLLKSPETNAGGKKSVRWKRQRHHRVYEYPPEPQSWHVSEVPTSSSPSTRRSWGSHSLDYLTLTDWELGGDEFLGDDSDDFEEFYTKGGCPPLNAPQIYSLAPYAYDKTHENLLGDGCDFYMGSPGSAFAFSRSSFTPSEYFPSQNPAGDFDYLFPDGASKENPRDSSENLTRDGVSGGGKTVAEEGKLSREKLRLDLPTLCLAESNAGERENETL